MQLRKKMMKKIISKNFRIFILKKRILKLNQGNVFNNKNKAIKNKLIIHIIKFKINKILIKIVLKG